MPRPRKRIIYRKRFPSLSFSDGTFLYCVGERHMQRAGYDSMCLPRDMTPADVMMISPRDGLVDIHTAYAGYHWEIKNPCEDHHPWRWWWALPNGCDPHSLPQ